MTIEYSITDIGCTLSGTVHVLTHWAEENNTVIAPAQQCYDAQTVGAEG